jgi:hypothetical protein
MAWDASLRGSMNDRKLIAASVISAEPARKSGSALHYLIVSFDVAKAGELHLELIPREKPPYSTARPSLSLLPMGPYMKEYQASQTVSDLGACAALISGLVMLVDYVFSSAKRLAPSKR